MLKSNKPRGRRSAGRFHRIVWAILIIYLVLPLVATLLYALAGNWQTTILPESWTLKWFQDLLHDSRFTEAFVRSIVVCGISLIVSTAVMVPTVIIVVLEFPKWEKVLNMLALIPYAVPGVVAAVGLIRLYSSGPLAISGTIWLLCGAYFVVVLPFMYQGIRNSLRSVNAVMLQDAAMLLGAGRWQAFRYVLLPNVMPGLTVSLLLSFAVLFGEFVLANLLVGGQYETIQIYLYRRQGESGHLSSAVSITYFVLVAIISGVMLRLGKRVLNAPSPADDDKPATGNKKGRGASPGTAAPGITLQGGQES
ncbi:ABC transporter permease [Paenibacillus glycinis]|uniref:ABC transporter permease subunit n=1 Tax=Paenibacillus glycinis TaxID=2697035 RepID=A0ABW9XJL0_9BACL|nr:ABC transporter permease [Paenibacillus glycinis]NBD22721.1 ABC transporter permease subunit [Paenibacillus glycinis]